MANKLRHIAISVRDPEKTAKFFEEAFGMTRAGNAQRGVYMTDGIFNVALLNFGDEPVAGMEDQKNPLGLIHFGMWVDSVDEMDKIRLLADPTEGWAQQWANLVRFGL